MKIACIYHNSIFCSWNFSQGIMSKLREMGHEAIDLGFVNRESEPDWSRVTEEPDFVLVTGPEHTPDKVRMGRKWKCPTAYWFHETLDRVDHDFLPTYQVMVKDADFNFFIREQDAKLLGGYHLPFAVDTTYFDIDGAPEWDKRKYKVATVGQLYPSRRKFLDEVRALTSVPIEVLQFVGEGKSPEEMVKALADSHRDTQVFISLPAMIRTTVCKTFEAAACGCCVITPVPNLEQDDNYAHLEVLRYDEAEPLTLAARLDLLIEEFEDVAKATAKLGYQRTMRDHRLDQRLQRIIDVVGGKK